MKIIHVFYSTLPSAKGGDIRSRDVIESQAEVGLDVLATSSPFQPPAEQGAAVETFGGIAYHRSYNAQVGLHISERDQGIRVKLRKAFKIFSYAKFITNLGRREKPDVIHAHSTFFCAFAGFMAARNLGVPLIYEVRSLWEERSVMQAPSLKTRLIAKGFRFIETLAMRMASHVVVISEGLRSDVQARGIAPSKITLIGNAASLTRIPKMSSSIEGKQPEDWDFGYIGNLSDIEGLDLLIEAVSTLRDAGWGNTLRLHGDGPAMTDLQTQAGSIAGIEFCGRFKPEDAPAIYGSIDVVVNPRRRSALTEKVTPLKPLEAMAYRKPVITSSVAGMLELVRDRETGFVFDADDATALAQTLLHIIQHPGEAVEVQDKAYHFVEAERSWTSNGHKYKAIYEAVLTGRSAE